MQTNNAKGNGAKWVLLWVDKELFSAIRAQMLSGMQKARKALLGGKLSFRVPLIDAIEYEIQRTKTAEKFDFLSETTRLSNEMETHSPSEAYQRFSSQKDFKSFIIQVVGELYYPFWAPNYIRGLSRFLLRLPDIPEYLKKNLENNLQLPDHALQHDFSEAMEKRGTYSFAQYLEWARKKYPGIDEDFKQYFSQEKPGIRTFVEQQEYCVTNFGHPNKPTLWVYFPVDAREKLPPPNGYINAKVIGIVCYNPNPPLKMSMVYLKAACLFGKLQL